MKAPILPNPDGLLSDHVSSASANKYSMNAIASNSRKPGPYQKETAESVKNLRLFTCFLAMLACYCVAYTLLGHVIHENYFHEFSLSPYL